EPDQVPCGAAPHLERRRARAGGDLVEETVASQQVVGTRDVVDVAGEPVHPVHGHGLVPLHPAGAEGGGLRWPPARAGVMGAAHGRPRGPSASPPACRSPSSEKR
ncbi:MAG: hypothetical protein ACK55I_24495, partial [bacterium]